MIFGVVVVAVVDLDRTLLLDSPTSVSVEKFEVHSVSKCHNDGYAADADFPADEQFPTALTISSPFKKLMLFEATSAPHSILPSSTTFFGSTKFRRADGGAS